MKERTRIKAFTLAEILITLSIIGVVAALTIPTLVSNNQKKAYITGLQKFDSEFQAAMKNYMQKEGCSDLACTGLFEGQNYGGGDPTTWATNANAQLASVFKGTKIYGNNDPVMRTFNTKILAGTSQSTVFRYGYTFALADGTLIDIQDPDAGNCTRWPAADASAKLKNSCAEIFVDVNGIKGPNTSGRDVFTFQLANNGNIYPTNGQDHAAADPDSDPYWQSWDGRCGTLGSATLPAGVLGNCSARIMEEGWEMNY